MNTTLHLAQSGPASNDNARAAILKYKLAQFDVDRAQIRLDAARSRVPQ